MVKGLVRYNFEAAAAEAGSGWLTFWAGAAVWLQCAPPKVNHRLRSFKGLRPRVVDFLGGVDDMAAVRAAKSQPSPTKFQGFAASSG